MFNNNEYCSHCRHIDYAGAGWVCCRHLDEDMRREHPELGEAVRISDKACLFFEQKEWY